MITPETIKKLEFHFPTPKESYRVVTDPQIQVVIRSLKKRRKRGYFLTLESAVDAAWPAGGDQI